MQIKGLLESKWEEACCKVSTGASQKEKHSGNFHSWSREDGKVKVEVEDPLRAHRELLEKYTDEIMHDLTAYLVTLK